MFHLLFLNEVILRHLGIRIYMDISIFDILVSLNSVGTMGLPIQAGQTAQENVRRKTSWKARQHDVQSSEPPPQDGSWKLRLIQGKES